MNHEKGSPAFQALMAWMEPFIKDVLKAQAPDEWMESKWEDDRDTVLDAVAQAWFLMLAFAADQNARLATDVENLDEDMLPKGFTSDQLDYMLLRFSTGHVDDGALRKVLRRGKASLASGEVLPPQMMELLRLYERGTQESPKT